MQARQVYEHYWIAAGFSYGKPEANAVLQLVWSEATKAKWLFPQEKATLE